MLQGSRHALLHGGCFSFAGIRRSETAWRGAGQREGLRVLRLSLARTLPAYRLQIYTSFSRKFEVHACDIPRFVDTLQAERASVANIAISRSSNPGRCIPHLEGDTPQTEKETKDDATHSYTTRRRRELLQNFRGFKGASCTTFVPLNIQAQVY